MSKKQSQLPRFAGRWLKWLGAPAYIIGDFVEEYEDARRADGRFQATLWLWRQLIGSTSALCQRRWKIMMKRLTKWEKQFLILSAFMLIPAMLLIIPGVLFSVFGLDGPMTAVSMTVGGSVWLSWLTHPLTILGGIGLAALLTAWPLIRVEVHNQQDRFVGSLTIRKGYWLHWAVLGTAVLFILLIFAYLLAENFGLFQLFS